jgi:hypothetical protein
MKITKRQLRRIIRESFESFSEAPSHDEVVQYLTDKADEYHADPSLIPGSIKTLLLDDFMDDLAHVIDISIYADLIDELSAGYTDADHKAAEEILATRMGSYKGTTLPDGRRIK